MNAVLLWWLAVSAIGLLALPLTAWLFERLPGGGLPFARPLGLLLCAYLYWLGGSLGIPPSGRFGLALALLGLGALSTLALRQTTPAALFQLLRRQWPRLLAAELIFALALAAWALLRAYTGDKIQPAGGEKFMEIAFLNSILHAPSFPPPDPWLSGYPISYYYFGYVQLALLARLSGLQPGVAFELHNALLFALALQLPFALVSELAASGGLRRPLRWLAGLAAAGFTALLGNLQGLLESLFARGWLPARLADWLALPGFPPTAPLSPSFYPGAGYWWWRASRVIRDLDLTGKPFAASPITEFPFFSFLLGDNHPHVLALPTVLLAAALALDWIHADALPDAKARRAGMPRLLLAALCTGALLFLNTWDFPIALALLLAAVLGGSYARRGRLTRAAWGDFAWRAAILVSGAALCFLPFLLRFTPAAGGILPYLFAPTRLVQYLVMFGPFVFILAAFLPAALAQTRPGALHPFSPRRAAAWWLRLAGGLSFFFLLLVALTGLVLVLDRRAGGSLQQTLSPWLGPGDLAAQLARILAARLSRPGLFLLLSLLAALAAALIRQLPRRAPAAPDLALLFTALLALFGLALTFSVEFVYLRDAFNLRMNTVFKFYFQGWLLLACAAAYALAWLIQHARPWPRALLCAASAALILAGLVYPLLAIPARAGSFRAAPVLDATAAQRQQNPQDWAVIDWLRENARAAGRVPVLLEATCVSYCPGGRISAFTGFPTVLGWSGHEAQWRSAGDELARRQSAVAAVYTAADPQNLLKILAEYQVDYIILGQVEQDYITARCAELSSGVNAAPCSPRHTLAQFQHILTPVISAGETFLFAAPGAALP